MQTINLMRDQTAVGKGLWIGAQDSADGKRSLHVGAVRNGSGSFSAQVKVYGANDVRFPKLLMTVTVNETSPDEGQEIYFKWGFFMAEVVSISGNATAVSVTMAV